MEARSNIVERLRDGAGADGWVHPDVAREAADEIERLRAEFELFREAPSKLEVAQYEIERLKAALDELAGLMQGVIDGDYEPDSFTLQPASRALGKSWETGGDNEDQQG